MRALGFMWLCVCSLISALYGTPNDTLLPVNPSSTLQNLPTEIQHDKDLDTQKDSGVQLDTYSLDGYSVLELNNQRFKENEIEPSLWRAGVGYKVYYKFHPAKNTFINFHFGTSIEITQNRLGGKVKAYDDGMFNEDYAYDWGSRILQSGSVSNFGVIISIAGKHHITLTIRQVFLDNAMLLRQYATNLPIISQIPLVGQQNQLTSATNRIFNNTQILASYSLYF